MSFSSKFAKRLVTTGCALVLGYALLLGGGDVTASATTKSSQKSASSTSQSTKGTSSRKHSKSRRGKRSRKTASWRRGQQRIDGDRAREIQQALIKEGYLHGSAAGTWDQTSQRAMEKFQADNGWQTKVVPDSRALIKLGLGPNHDHLLNPESAMTGPIPSASATARPDAPGGSSIPPVASDGTGANQPQK
jgi:Putative peptidoglycan binding domain